MENEEFMKKALVIFLLFFLVIGCKSKKTKLADNDVVEVDDFVEFFTEIKLPILVDDSLIAKAETDSSTIGYKIFTQFTPDTVISKQFSKYQKLKIYPFGKVAINKYETYLFVKVISSSRKAVYIIALNNDKKFVASMPLVVEDKDPSTSQMATMDKRYTITQTTQRKKSAGDISETKNVYILNAEAHAFSLIMTDQGTSDEVREIINPIDTLSRKNKFSGDYIKDKRNYVSIRDGKKPSEMLFFIHFEKSDNNEICSGELKGEAMLRGTKTAVFRAIGNPCVLEFTLGSSSVALKEQQACGSYRDIKCFFDGSFTKTKEPKQKAVVKKKK